MTLFILALSILTAIQFAHYFVIAAFVAVFVAVSMAVSHVVFKVTGAPQ
jgi:hypothetical protein